MRIDRERAAVEHPRFDAPPEARGDIAAVKELHGIARAEAERPLRVGQRLPAAAVSRERPTEDVVADDARALRVAASREHERVREPPSVVDVEEGDVEVVADAVRGEQPLDHVDEPVLAAVVREVAEKSDVLRERHTIDGRARCGDRCTTVTERRLRLCEGIECERVAGEGSERGSYLPQGGSWLPRGELEQTELHARPRVRLALADCRGGRELHRPL